MEYALVLVLVAVVVFAVIHLLGDRVSSVFDCTAQAIAHTITARCGHDGRL